MVMIVVGSIVDVEALPAGAPLQSREAVAVTSLRLGVTGMEIWLLGRYSAFARS
jgi:hypothetical protein